MPALLSLLLSHLGSIATIAQLVRQGIEIAPEVISEATAQWTAIQTFLSEKRDPTQEEMDALIIRRKALEDRILAAQI